MDVFDVKCLVWGKKLVSSSVVRCATCPSSPHRIFTFTPRGTIDSGRCPDAQREHRGRAAP